MTRHKNVSLPPLSEHVLPLLNNLIFNCHNTGMTKTLEISVAKAAAFHEEALERIDNLSFLPSESRGERR